MALRFPMATQCIVLSGWIKPKRHFLGALTFTTSKINGHQANDDILRNAMQISEKLSFLPTIQQNRLQKSKRTFVSICWSENTFSDAQLFINFGVCVFIFFSQSFLFVNEQKAVSYKKIARINQKQNEAQIQTHLSTDNFFSSLFSGTHHLYLHGINITKPIQRQIQIYTHTYNSIPLCTARAHGRV